MVVGTDNKAHKKPVAVGLSTRTGAEVTRGLKPGARVSVRGQNDQPEGAAVTVESNEPRARRPPQSRAILLVTAMLALAGTIASSGFRADLSAARVSSRRRRRAFRQHASPVDDVDSRASARAGHHGSAGNTPGSLADVSRRYGISAQFEPGTDTVVALQMVQNRSPRFALDCQLTRSWSSIGRRPPFFPSTTSISPARCRMPISTITGSTWLVRRCRGSGRGPCRRVSQRHTRNRSHRRSTRMLAAQLIVDDVAQAFRGANLLQPVGHYPQNGLQRLVLASGLWQSLDDIAATPVIVKPTATIRVRDIGVVVRARQIARRSSLDRAATQRQSASRSRSAQISCRSVKGSRTRSNSSSQRSRAAFTWSRHTTSPSSCRAPSPTSATRS